MKGDRIVIASFTTDGNPPSGRVLVAVLHLLQKARERWDREARVLVAAGPDGEKFEAAIDLARKKGEDHE